MEQSVVSNLDKSLETELRNRAELHGWSLEEEIRQILMESIFLETRAQRTRFGPARWASSSPVGAEPVRPVRSRPGAEVEPAGLGLGSRISARFVGVGLVGEIPEWRGQPR